MSYVCPTCGKEVELAVDPGYQRLSARCCGRAFVTVYPNGPWVDDIPGIGEEIARQLHELGWVTVDQLQDVTDEELLQVAGIGEKTLIKIRNFMEV